jgi:hypothetical protein
MEEWMILLLLVCIAITIMSFYLKSQVSMLVSSVGLSYVGMMYYDGSQESLMICALLIMWGFLQFWGMKE